MNGKTKPNFKIILGSPVDYEELVVYIQDHGEEPPNFDLIFKKAKECIKTIMAEEVALLHQEDGPDKVKIQFAEYVKDRELDLDHLMKTLQAAKKELLGE